MFLVKGKVFFMNEGNIIYTIGIFYQGWVFYRSEEILEFSHLI